MLINFNDASRPSLESGKRIKNYVYNYHDIIGQGNFAKVYKGLNTITQQTIAIKVVSLDALKSKHLQELVFQQIRILQQMNHPNILRFYEALLSQRNCYIITQLCNEGDLEEKIKHGKISDSEFSKLVIDIYNGLKYLKQMGVCHRDIKTANIFFNNGQAKIADFGLAKFYKQRFHDLDIGSPLYMSPEGLIQNCYSDKTDVWAFGIVLYEVIHGTTPFVSCKSQYDLKTAVIKPIPQHKFNRNIHPYLRQLINNLLEINQQKRPNIHELQNDPFIKMISNNNHQPQGINLSISKNYQSNSLQSSKNSCNLGINISNASNTTKTTNASISINSSITYAPRNIPKQEQNKAISPKSTLIIGDRVSNPPRSNSNFLSVPSNNIINKPIQNKIYDKNTITNNQNPSMSISIKQNHDVNFNNFNKNPNLLIPQYNPQQNKFQNTLLPPNQVNQSFNQQTSNHSYNQIHVQQQQNNLQLYQYPNKSNQSSQLVIPHQFNQNNRPITQVSKQQPPTTQLQPSKIFYPQTQIKNRQFSVKTLQTKDSLQQTMPKVTKQKKIYFKNI